MSMRRNLIWCLALATTAALCVAGIASAADTGNNVSTVTQKITPTAGKLSAKKQKPIKLFVEVTTLTKDDTGTATHPTKFPSPAKETDVSFDKNMTFNYKGLPTCKASQVDGTTRDQALAACKKAQVGTGSAVACASNGAGGCALVVNADVLAFNGAKQGGNPGFLLWTNNQVTGETTLPAVLKPAKSPYGKTLFVTVPPLGGGAGSITEFQTTVNKTFKFKGKKVGYTSAACPKSHKLIIHSHWDFTDGSHNDADGSGKC
jgi:hypothetical protein